jgi:hypothetical protein
MKLNENTKRDLARRFAESGIGGWQAVADLLEPIFRQKHAEMMLGPITNEEKQKWFFRTESPSYLTTSDVRIEEMLASRRAQCAPKVDPAVEAAMKILNSQPASTLTGEYSQDPVRELSVKLVAAIDEARGRK